MIKMVALDIDGTLLNSERIVPQKNIDAIHAAMDRGVYVIFSTGRTLTTLSPDLLEIGMPYAVTSNGSILVDLKALERIDCLYHTKEDLVRIFDLIRPLSDHCIFEAFLDGRAYMEKHCFENIKSYGLGEGHDQYISWSRTPMENLLDYVLAHPYKVENINVKFTTEAEKLAFSEKLTHELDLPITSAFWYNVEIGPRGSTKGNGIKRLCKILDIDISEVLACGDSMNDMEMLKTVGFPVAMGNACEELKSIAKYVSASNDDCGVALAIEKFVL